MEVPVNRLNRFEHLQKMAQHFWKRWHDKYLNILINRPKWLKKQRNFREGDVVVIKEDNTPPLRWNLGRIEEASKGSDGLIRFVTVRTRTGVYKRPITKLGLLVATDESEVNELNA